MLALADEIQKYLLPILGERVSRRFILAYCAKYNIQPHEIGDNDLKTVGIYLRDNLQFFVGTQRAHNVLEQLQKQMVKSKEMNR
ncbi:MAG: hypothetical protein C4527_17475 [Candidatus Omnitrophota bacterium]|jgi:hypothetical protein|nr:MAG: hypothetical protein C4527_17475 [Candidatus Omnitrophota bacterium]